ncbi:MAG: glycosyltransferase [Acidimicrobiia bacterium]|nr:glycosyltransferase [Acidimicrobiia bacterium]
MHILQITNHGLHEWQVTPGLPDTGGQNVYVNELSAALVRLGHRVTIVNRGGYPHPLTGEPRVGTFPGLGGQAEIVYLTDETRSFVRKEDMEAQLPALSAELDTLMSQGEFDLILSHYWDGALLGVLANQMQDDRLPHLWVPHSLGALKRRNVDPAKWSELRIEERIDAERRLMTEVDGVVATSVAIRDSARNDYDSRADYFLPPGVDHDRYQPRGSECESIWEFLAGVMGVGPGELHGRPLILEVSRTDTTKRKDVLIRAFSDVVGTTPRPLLAVTIDDVNQVVHDALTGLIDELGLHQDVAVLGSVWDQLPCLYSEAAVYCTPSIMEGFGMSAQEAAATAMPVVASDRVPFAVEYLLGPRASRRIVSDSTTIEVGDGAIVVPADSVEGFAVALDMLLSDDELRGRMGAAAYRMTVPAFGWDRLAASFLEEIERGEDV